MNPAPPPQPPLQPSQPHQLPTSCDRHPDENFTGFCPSCLFERLSVLHPNPSPPSSSARKSSAAALKSIFFPELRRAKSFSASKNDAFSSSTAFEPLRKSCDVRVRISNNEPSESDSKNLASLSRAQEATEEESNEEHNVSSEIIEQEEIEVNGVDEEIEELKSMKDHIDLRSSSTKKPKGSFWSAASVFSKKLQKWRQKQKDEKESKKLRRRNPAEKPIGRNFRETQSEVADYGFGRRSCDVDPRFSLDARRISFDDPRYSIDEPRASCDGYLTGRTGNFPRILPPLPTMLSVAEDDVRSNSRFSVDWNEDNHFAPGGSAQTKEYYSDSFRRKSFDRSNSMRKSDMEELKSFNRSNSVSNITSSIVSNVAKVIPAASINGLHDRDECFAGEIGDRKEAKSSRRWSIWGFINRRGKNKDGDRDSSVNGGDGFGGRLMRSNSSVSWRNGGSLWGVTRNNGSWRNGGSLGGVTRNNGNCNGRDEFVLERNRSARYEVDNNGLLGFYLTPLGVSRSNGSVKTS